MPTPRRPGNESEVTTDSTGSCETSTDWRRNGGRSSNGLTTDLHATVPWIVPRFQRRSDNLDELPEFFESWRRRLGTAVIDGPVRWPAGPGESGVGPGATHPPPARDRWVAMNRMTVLSDGSVPVLETDLAGLDAVGSVDRESVESIWPRVVEARRRFEIEHDAPPTPWRCG